VDLLYGVSPVIKGIVMNEEELLDLIDRVSDRFEQSFHVRVIQAARTALFLPARPHIEDVTRNLELNIITISFLENSVYEILNHAYADNRKPDLGLIDIDYDAVQRSMQRYCPYLFWC
jgi:hypothetical protein